MEKNRYRKNVLILILLICVLSLSVAFAAFSQSLNINGTATTEASISNWNISFGNIRTLNTGGYATGNSSKDTTEKSITFTCEFVAANDNCELTANIVNKGTINALYTNANLTVTKDAIATQNTSTSYDDGIIVINLTPPTGWQENATILKADESGEFKITATLKDLTSLTESTKYTITTTFSFEQAENK